MIAKKCSRFLRSFSDPDFCPKGETPGKVLIDPFYFSSQKPFFRIDVFFQSFLERSRSFLEKTEESFISLVGVFDPFWKTGNDLPEIEKGSLSDLKKTPF